MPKSDSSIEVLLFARYAELFGTERIAVPAGGVTTVGDLLAHVRGLPGGTSLGAGALVAVNLRQAGPGDRVSAGDEVAILPPLAGG